MPLFQYTAFRQSGQKIFGEKEAETKEEVVNYLYSQGLSIISIQEKFDLNFQKIANIEIGGLSLADRVILVKQMATMFSAGIPIIQALDILIQQTEKDSLKTKLKRIYRSIESGSSLYEAFRKEGGIFSEVQLNLLAAGEKSGNMNEMLLQIAIDLEKSKNLRGKILGAMIYPIILFVVMAVVVALMIVFMIPQVEELYESISTEAELPVITKLFVNVGTFLGKPLNIFFAVIILISSYLAFRYYTSTKGGKRNVHKLKLKIPVFGKLMQKIELVQFCRLTSMLIKSGISVVEAIEIVANASGNVLYKDTLVAAKDEIMKGSAFSLAIAKQDTDKVFPLMLLKTLATAEESGKLDKILEDMGKFYEAEVNEMTDNLTKLMEPMILVVVGGLVAFLAVSVYLPIYQVGQYLE
jgi:type IV pilus assembly protein PilC